MRLGLAMALVVTALLTGCSSSTSTSAGISADSGGHPARSTAITISSMGGVRLNEAKSAVDAALGESPAESSDGLVRYPAAALVVIFHQRHVVSIATDDARYRTTHGGVGVGSRLAAVKKLANISCINLGDSAFDCKMDDAGGAGAPPLIDFQGEHGKVESVEVQSVNE